MSSATGTMKAYRLHRYGGPETIQLDDIPVPTPGPSQALVAISHVGMNPFDWKIREGHVKDVLPLDLPTTLGVDLVGEVVALGKKASERLKVGDRVMTMSTSLGAFAEYITVDSSILALVPKEISDEQAATLPIPALSAYQALYAAGPITPGQKILIHGASGIVGAFAVQFAKAVGAFVIGTASGKNKEYVLGLGADQFIDYTKKNFEDVVSEIDLVLDFVLVGGDRGTTDRSWGVLKFGGAIVSLADPTAIFKTPDGYKGYFPTIEPNAKQLGEIAGMLVQGKIKSKVAKMFGRNELIEAMEVNKAGGTTGRLVVDFKRV